MNFVFYLLITLVPLISLASINVKTVAIVNNEIISDLDVEKNIKIITTFFQEKITDENIDDLSLNNLIRNILIRKEAKNLNIIITEKELTDYVDFFLSFHNLKGENLLNYAERNNLDYKMILKSIESEKMLGKIIERKIIPFTTVSNDEIYHFQQQKKTTSTSDYVVNIMEVLYPISEHDKSNNSIANILNSLSKSSDITELKNTYDNIVVNNIHMNSSYIAPRIKNLIDNKKVGEIVGPLLSNNHYLLLKIIDKVFLNQLPNHSTVSIKNFYLDKSINDYNYKINFLKKQNLNCDNIKEISNNIALKEPKTIKVNVLNLNPNIQALLQKIKEKNQTSGITSDDKKSNIIILCNIEDDIELIRKKIHSNKLTMQINSLIDDMYKNSFIEK